MKKIYFLVLTFFVSLLQVNAQSLSLDELIYLRSKDADAVNTYLSAKGWVFDDASEETDDEYSKSSWAYGKQMYSNRAKAFFKLMSADGYYSKVSYLTQSKVQYDIIKAKVSAYKMLKISSNVKNGYLVTSYAGENYVVETSLSTDEDSSIPVYGISISKRQKQMQASFLEAQEDAADREREDGASSQEKEEVLQSYQIENYKNLINGKYMQAPPASDFIFLDEPNDSVSDCNLIPEVANPMRVYCRLNAGDRVYVLSRLLGESHDYYLVYSRGYYGYVKNINLKSYGH